MNMRLASLLISLFLHVAVVTAGLLWAGSRPAMIKLDVPVYQVDLVSLAPAPPPPPKPQVKKAEPAKAQPVKKAPEAKAKPKPVKAPPKPQPKKAEISPKKSEQKPRIKKKPQPTPEQVMAEALEKAKAEAKRKEEEQRAAEEKRKREEAEKLKQDLAALRAKVDKENAAQAEARAQSQAGQAASGVVQVYASMVENLIKQNWRYPSLSLDGGLYATVELTLAPDGTITSARLTHSSGRADFDSSALKAVTETETLPPPPVANIDTIQINFNEQELMQ